jgi:hypothetical protein
MGQHVRHRADQTLHIGNVKEFVGAVSVGERAEHSSDDELRLGPKIAEEGQEGDGSSLRHGKWGLAEVSLAGLLEHLI